MGQRQFRFDDTSHWFEGYGKGIDGALTISGATTDSPINAPCRGTAGTGFLAAANTSFAPDQCIIIHQTQGTGAGNWELNVVSSYTPGTITTKYPLTNNYILGAQAQVLKQYSSITVGGGTIWLGSAWNGAVGGIFGFLCSGAATFIGSLNLDSCGFRKGNPAPADHATGYQGEGTPGLGSQLNSPNGNGGGAGSQPGLDGASGGGGGGLGTGGANGGGGQQSSQYIGVGGSAEGNASLTTLFLGGGGGSPGWGAREVSPGQGANGGGIILIIASAIVIGNNFTANGGTGTNGLPGDPSYPAGGGGGAGGSILLKARFVTLGSAITAAGGPGGPGSTVGGQGGAGGSGRIHVDYANALSGATTPAFDATQDRSLGLLAFGGLL